MMVMGPGSMPVTGFGGGAGGGAQTIIRIGTP
jgi:hypothetical protein